MTREEAIALEDLEEYQANNGLTGDGYRIIDTKEALKDGKGD